MSNLEWAMIDLRISIWIESDEERKVAFVAADEDLAGNELDSHDLTK